MIGLCRGLAPLNLEARVCFFELPSWQRPQVSLQVFICFKSPLQLSLARKEGKKNKKRSASWSQASAWPSLAMEFKERLEKNNLKQHKAAGHMEIIQFKQK